MKINLWNGDCLELMKKIPDKSIDLILTDPPYLFQAEGGGCFGSKNKAIHNQVRPISDGFNFELFNEFSRVMKKINIYIYGNKDLIFKLICHLEPQGYNLDLLFWNKTNPLPMCNNKYLSDTEYILFIREKAVPLYGTYHTKKKLFQSPLNIKDKKKYGHPTIKPVNQLEVLINNSSKENDVVLDCFMGSGSTGVACINTNRKFIGIEKDKEYFKIAKDRIKNAQKEKKNDKSN